MKNTLQPACATVEAERWTSCTGLLGSLGKNIVDGVGVIAKGGTCSAGETWFKIMAA